MTKAVTCDNAACGKLGRDPFNGWLSLTRNDDWDRMNVPMGVSPEQVEWDFCSFPCLARWADERLKKGSHRGPP